jgi:hypothetical protein
MGPQTPPAPDSFDYGPKSPEYIPTDMGPRTPPEPVRKYGAVPPPGARIQEDTVLGPMTPPEPPAPERPEAWFELGPGESPDYGPGPEGETSAEFSRRTGIYPGSGTQSPVEKYLPQKIGGASTPPKEINILTNLTEPKSEPESDPEQDDNDNEDKKKIIIKI